MTNSFDDADSHARPLFEQLLLNCAKAGVPCRIVDIIRTEPQQLQKIKDGVSWTKRSMHLPQPPEGKSKAIDIVPLSILGEHKPSWDPGHPDWQKIGPIGETLGLEWGGRWTEHPDPSHFQDNFKTQLPTSTPEDMTSTT
jgi:peptidoglycan L-alanyl-D-glutamate endopeptidase CwlK